MGVAHALGLSYKRVSECTIRNTTDLHEEKLVPTMCLCERGVELDAGTIAYKPDMQVQPLYADGRTCDVQR